jgi:transposase
VDDDLWALIEPLLPAWPDKAPGPRPAPDRLCLQGILYVLHNDIAWQLLPPELGFGSGQTCWRRLERWQVAGVFDRLHRILLAGMNAAGAIDWSRACADGSHVRAKKGGRHRSVAGRPPEDRQQAPPDLRRTRHTAQGHHHRGQRQRRLSGPRPGRQHPADRRPSRPSAQPPDTLLGDKGYDSNPNGRELRRRGITPFISRRGDVNIPGLGKLRYVVEQTFALLHQFKRIAVRWEHRTELHDAFISLACSLICWRRLKPDSYQVGAHGLVR